MILCTRFRSTLHRELKRHSVTLGVRLSRGTSGKVTASNYHSFAEKAVAAHPQGGKNVERS
jgi:hypothetical protein